MDALEDARVERLLDAVVGEPAVRRRRQVQQLAVAGADVVLGELEGEGAVVLGGGGVLQEHVDAVEPGVAEGAAGVVEAAAEVGVPEVVEEGERRLVGGQRVAGAEAADGDGDGSSCVRASSMRSTCREICAWLARGFSCFDRVQGRGQR